ncbi:MAG: DUF2752 domain-containing protein [Sedimentisphaerales bacterium]|nr:DUF2752 domain-containing protein [Sedimentisphaerales bacterium]
MSRTCDITISSHAPLAATADSAAGRGEGGFDAAVLAVSLAVLAGSFLLRPHEGGLSLFGCRWPFYCWLHETFGLRCALCGMSRSFCALAHGHVAASLAFHPLGPAAFVLFCLEIPYRVPALSGRSRRRRATLKKAHAWAVALVAVAILVNWLLYLGGLVL